MKTPTDSSGTILILMLQVTNLTNTKRCKEPCKMTENLANGYSSESTQQLELSNEYQHDRVYISIKDRCVLVLWTNVTSAFEGLKQLEKVALNLSHSSQKQHDTLLFLIISMTSVGQF